MSNKTRIHVDSFDGRSASIRVDYEHIVDALAMYFQSMPAFPIATKADIIDVDLGMEVDEEGFVEVDLIYSDG